MGSQEERAFDLHWRVGGIDPEKKVKIEMGELLLHKTTHDSDSAGCFWTY